MLAPAWREAATLPGRLKHEDRDHREETRYPFFSCPYAWCLRPVPWALRVIAEKPRKLYCAAFHCDWYALSVIYNARVYIWRQSSIDSFT